jgi:hypothetical protein
MSSSNAVLSERFIKLIHPALADFLLRPDPVLLTRIDTPFRDATGGLDLALWAREEMSSAALGAIREIGLFEFFEQHLQEFPSYQQTTRLSDPFVLFICMFTNPTADQLPTEARQALRLFTGELARLLTTPARLRILHELASVFELVLLSAFIQPPTSLYRELLGSAGPFPPHLTSYYKQRVLLVALHPEQKQCIYHLQSLTFPKLHLIAQPLTRTQRRLGIDHINEIRSRLPVITLHKPPKFIKEWDDRLWHASLYDDCSVVNARYNTTELLLQIIIFLLPNWDQLWFEADLPCSFEVMRRLGRLKEDNWQPKPQEYVKAIMGFRAPLRAG